MIENAAGFLDGLIRMTRTNDFKQLAREDGFEYDDQDSFSTLPVTLRGFYIFKKKKGVIKRILTKTNVGIPSTVLRIYDFINLKDDIETTTIIEIENPDFKFSPFFIYPRSVFTALKHLFVSEEIIFDDLPEFNNNYKLASTRSDVISLQLNKSALEITSKKKKIYIEGDDRYLIFYYKNKPLEITDIKRDYNFALDFVDRLLYDQTDDFV